MHSCVPHMLKLRSTELFHTIPHPATTPMHASTHLPALGLAGAAELDLHVLALWEARGSKLVPKEESAHTTVSMLPAPASSSLPSPIQASTMHDVIFYPPHIHRAQLTKRDELLLRTVLALPNASSSGFDSRMTFFTRCKPGKHVGM